MSLIAQTARADRFVKEAGADAVKLETAPDGETTIGIGAGRHVDGQVLVITDVLGLGGESFKLSKQYTDLDGTIRNAAGRFVSEVRNGEFPAREHVYDPIDDEE